MYAETMTLVSGLLSVISSRVSRVGAGFLCALLLNACAQTPTQEVIIPGLSNNIGNTYQAEKQKLIDRDPNVNFDTLRWEFRSSDAYQAWDTREHEASLAMFNAFEDQNYDLCMRFADAILELNYVSLGGHFGAYSCSTAQSKNQQAAFHRYVISGLIESIEKSGDGQSAESAYVTISPSEMRSYMQIRGLTSYRQELVDVPAKYIEKFYAIDTATEDHVEVYFDNTASLIGHLRPKIKPPEFQLPQGF